MRPAAEILLIAVEEIGKVLSEASLDDANNLTACDPWTVRDVLAHCSGSMLRVIEDRTHGYTPEENEIDVAERRSWAFDRITDELQTTVQPTAARIDGAAGPLDGLGIGVWIHAGDIREALGIGKPYAGPGVDLALRVLEDRSRRLAFGVDAALDDRVLRLGTGPTTASLACDADTFVRVVAGRNPDPTRYTLTGSTPGDLTLFS